MTSGGAPVRHGPGSLLSLVFLARGRGSLYPLRAASLGAAPDGLRHRGSSPSLRSQHERGALILGFYNASVLQTAKTLPAAEDAKAEAAEDEEAGPRL